MTPLPIAVVPPTDADLLERWREIVAIHATGTYITADLQHRIDMLGHDWQTQVERRRRGELTDTTVIDAAAKIVQGTALMHGFAVRHYLMPASQYGVDPFCQRRMLASVYSGKPEDFNDARWMRLMSACEEELKAMPWFVRPSPNEDIEEHERPKQSKRIYIGEGSLMRWGTAWYLDTIVWYGPESLKSPKGKSRPRGRG